MPGSPEPISCRLLHERSELEHAARVVVAVWGESATGLVSAELLRAYSHFGNPVIGAFHEGALCGVSIGFLAAKGGVHLHSHITGVVPSHQHLGIGFRLKVAQRAWCLDNDIDHVTWTFDPLLARNAHFNIRKLGALSDKLLPDFYGPMSDDVNRGDTSDRLEVRWPVAAVRVEQAIAAKSSSGNGAGGPPPALDGSPVVIVRTVPLPADYHALRREDPAAAERARCAVRGQLADAFGEGLEIVDFDRATGYGLAPVKG